MVGFGDDLFGYHFVDRELTDRAQLFDAGKNAGFFGGPVFVCGDVRREALTCPSFTPNVAPKGALIRLSLTKRDVMGAEKSKLTPAKRKQSQSAAASDERFFVVGIGASAGGLEALEEFFKNLPNDTGMAYVVVSHQHPGHVSLLPELLGRCAAIPVAEAGDGEVLKPNRVYVNPPGAHLGLMSGHLELMDVPADEQPALLIDFFFRALAADQKERAICVVLSGTGTDGTLGLRAVKGDLGMAMVQSIDSARFAGMPASAIATSMADFVLPPSAMPAQLVAYAKGLQRLRSVFEGASHKPEVAEPLQKIFMLLRAHTGHDFSSYKQSTMLRRIERRMAAHRLEQPGRYVRLLQENPHELDILFKELLIVVTSFFRDPEAFEQLREKVLPALLEKLSSPGTFRVWVAGCGTGEEAYSIAILLHEAIRKLAQPVDVQIFATDLSEPSIEYARQGRYPEGIASEVPPELLKRCFLHEDGFYRVREDIRKMLVFAQQNVIKDPPFTKVDLLCCRNLLIYLNSDLQKRLLPLFHYALKPGGVLMLGPSETIDGHTDLFEPLNKKWKLFRRLDAPATHPLPEIPAQPSKRSPQVELPKPVKSPSLTAQLQTLLLDRLVPPSVVVNNRGDIIYIHGRTGDYLEPRAGQPRMNIHDMAREGLSPALGSAMRQALAQEQEVVRERVRVKANDHFTDINLSVVAISAPETLRGLLLVSFRPAPLPEESAESPARPDDAAHLRDLEREIQYTKESLQSTVEELETSNEELKSANEELQSANEELQSTNEELETSKEELQSLNEELSTVNAELETKVAELSHANDDMQNLLDNTHIATLYLDNELRIKRYTDQTRNIIKLIPSDMGRPIGDLVSNLKYDKLEQDARTVLQNLAVSEQEVQSVDGRWYLTRIMPYRTAENLLDGVVATFVDISSTKAEKAEAQDAIDFLRDIFDTFHEPSLVLDAQLRVTAANQTFYTVFETNPQKTEGQLLYDVGGGEWDIPKLRELLEKIIPQQTAIKGFEVEGYFPKIGHQVFLLNARKIERGDGLPGLILLSMKEKK